MNGFQNKGYSNVFFTYWGQQNQASTEISYPGSAGTNVKCEENSLLGHIKVEKKQNFKR